MARVSRTPRKAPAQQEQDMHSNLNALYGDTSHLNPEPQGGDTPQPQGPTVEGLMERIEALSRQVEQQQLANLALTQAPPQQTPQAPPALSFEGLPDPLHDAEGYARALTQRIFQHSEATRTYEQQVSQQRQQGNDRYALLFEDFSIQHPDLADDEELLRIATETAVNKVRRRGIDVDRYMFGNTQRFFSDVVKEHERLFGKRDTADAGHEGNDGGHRTGGIFGGQESGGRPGANRSQEKPGDMIKELQEVQRKMGMF